MGWATNYIALLEQGQSVRFRPRGHSMTGIIDDGNLVQVDPLARDPRRGDVVLCKVRGVQYLHLVSAVRGNQFQISNNFRHVNGWTARHNIYGIVTAVNPPQ